MIRFSKILLYITIILLLFWLIPWGYGFIFSKPQKNPFILYSTVINDFAILENNGKGTERKDLKGKYYTESEFDSILPMFWALKPQVSAPAASRPVLRIPTKMRRMPSHMLPPVIFGSTRPTISTTRPPTSRPTKMEIREDSSLLNPSLRPKVCNFSFMPAHHPFPHAWRLPYRGPAPAP